MNSIVPVTRYLGFDRREGSAQLVIYHSSQIAGHCPLTGKTSAYRLAENNSPASLLYATDSKKITSLFDAPNGSAQLTELFFDGLIATVQMVDPIDFSLTISHQTC